MAKLNNTEYHHKIGKVLRRYRLLARYTMQELVDELNYCTYQQWCKYESGKNQISFLKLAWFNLLIEKKLGTTSHIREIACITSAEIAKQQEIKRNNKGNNY